MNLACLHKDKKVTIAGTLGWVNGKKSGQMISMGQNLGSLLGHDEKAKWEAMKGRF